MAVLLIARFSGDVADLTRAYDRGHAMIMAAGGAEQFGELRNLAAAPTGSPRLTLLPAGPSCPPHGLRIPFLHGHD